MKIELDVDLKTVEETLDTLVGRAFSLTHYFEPHPAAGSVAKQRQHASSKAKALLEFAAKLFIAAGKPSFNDEDLNDALRKQLTPIIKKLELLNDAESSLSALQENVVIDINGKKYKRVSDEAFREFTGYDKYQITHPETRPRKFFWTLKSAVSNKKEFVDWRGRELTSAEEKDGVFADFGRQAKMGDGPQAVWYPDGKVFYFDDHLYEPVE